MCGPRGHGLVGMGHEEDYPILIPRRWGACDGDHSPLGSRGGESFLARWTRFVGSSDAMLYAILGDSRIFFV